MFLSLSLYIYIYIHIHNNNSNTSSHNNNNNDNNSNTNCRTKAMSIHTSDVGNPCGDCSASLHHTCHILPPSEIDWGLFLAVFTGSEGKHLFHRIGRKGRIWQLCACIESIIFGCSRGVLLTDMPSPPRAPSLPPHLRGRH